MEKREGVEVIEAKDLDPEAFIPEKVAQIQQIVGKEKAIVALSGGIDSSVTAILANMALGQRLIVVFVDNALMREGEPRQVVETFRELGIAVRIICARKKFIQALKGITDPEKKREAITKAFYKELFPILVEKLGARFILHGTIFTDIEETVAGIKRQHNIIEQLGIDTEKEFGYKLIEPLKELRKDGVRKVAKALKLPDSIVNRMPFPGPALAARIARDVTEEKLKIVRKATAIVEEILKVEAPNAFQYMAILHDDKAAGIREGKRKLGYIVQVRCWDSVDATTATPTKLEDRVRKMLNRRITREIPEVVNVTFNETPKPPLTMEIV